MIIKKLTDFNLVEQFLTNTFSSPTHWPEWNILISELYKTKFYYLGAFENGKLIGICPIHEEIKGILKNLYSGQFHYIPNGGWIFNKKTYVKNIASLSTLIQFSFLHYL